MAKTLWHITMSLDGFIAGPGDDMSWLGGHTGPNATVDEVLPRIGAILMGARTYQPASTEEGSAYGGAWNGPQFVLTHDAPENAREGFTFVGGDIAAAVATVQAAAGDGYVALLGATVARECLEAGLLDEILVHLAPVLLGDGVRLFSHPGGTNVVLDRIRATPSPSVTDLWFRVRR
jgi:dihydrofolate reductase